MPATKEARDFRVQGKPDLVHYGRHCVWVLPKSTKSKFIIFILKL